MYCYGGKLAVHALNTVGDKKKQKISPPPGFDSDIAQPMASLYADCAIPAPRILMGTAIIFLVIVMTVSNQRRRNVEDSLSHLNCEWLYVRLWKS